MVVEFKGRMRLKQAVMMNLRPIGLFVNTPFAPDQATELDLRVHVEETGEVFNSRVVVVSVDVGPEFSTAMQGMGLKFRDANCELRAVLDELCGFHASTSAPASPR